MRPLTFIHFGQRRQNSPARIATRRVMVVAQFDVLVGRASSRAFVLLTFFCLTLARQYPRPTKPTYYPRVIPRLPGHAL